MKTVLLLLALVVASALADGFGSHSHRNGRRLRNNNRNGVRGGRNLRNGRNRGGRTFRRGRQESALGAYGAPVDPLVDPLVDDYVDPTGLPPAPTLDYEDGSDYVAPLDDYGTGGGNGINGGGNGGLNGNGGFNGNGGGASGDSNIAMLEKAVPGVPGVDYPIYASVPETAFSCDGQVEGGYYADPSAECQVFHICTADGEGGLAKYSFLCPNGTVFNQEYFICDWWFNFDCSQAEALYGRNDEIRAEQESNIGAVGGNGNGNGGGFGGNGNGGFGGNGNGFGNGFGNGNGNGNGGFNGGSNGGGSPDLPVYVDNGDGDLAGELPALPDYTDDYPVDDLGVTDAPLAAYGAPVDNGNGVDEAVAPIGAYGAPGDAAERAARRFRVGRARRGRQGRRLNARRNNRNNRRGNRFNNQRRGARAFHG